MINAIAFVVPGEPFGKQSARVGKRGKFARAYMPQETVNYEAKVALAAAQAMRGAPLLTGACRIELDIMRSIPASWSARKQSDAMLNIIRPTVKPDSSNVLKAIEDGMTGVVWVDDKQAVEHEMRKMYSMTPGVRVRVAEL